MDISPHMTPDDYPENFVPQVGSFSFGVPASCVRDRDNLRDLEQIATLPIYPQNTINRSLKSPKLIPLYLSLSSTKEVCGRESALITPASIRFIPDITLGTEGRA